MKHIILVVVGVVTIQTSANAQTAAETIERALAAAPRRAREEAAVIKWNADYTYETLKEGTNRLVCYNRSDERNRRPFAVVCTSVGNLDRAAQNRRFRGESADAEEERAMVAAAEENGTRVLPEYGSGSTWTAAIRRARGSTPPSRCRAPPRNPPVCRTTEVQVARISWLPGRALPTS